MRINLRFTFQFAFANISIFSLRKDMQSHVFYRLFLIILAIRLQKKDSLGISYFSFLMIEHESMKNVIIYAFRNSAEILKTRIPNRMKDGGFSLDWRETNEEMKRRRIIGNEREFGNYGVLCKLRSSLRYTQTKPSITANAFTRIFYLIFWNKKEIFLKERKRS